MEGNAAWFVLGVTGRVPVAVIRTFRKGVLVPMLSVWGAGRFSRETLHTFKPQLCPLTSSTPILSEIWESKGPMKSLYMPQSIAISVIVHDGDQRLKFDDLWWLLWMSF